MMVFSTMFFLLIAMPDETDLHCDFLHISPATLRRLSGAIQH